jgi:ketosteroid isomerase-like protein
VGVSEAAASDVRALIERYNDAWNRHDVDAICAMHAPGMVFENHTAGERAAGDEVRGHIASIFASWPDIAFEARRLYATGELAVCEWTASATRDGRRLSWPGVDVFPIRDGRIARKDVYSASGRVAG